MFRRLLLCCLMACIYSALGSSPRSKPKEKVANKQDAKPIETRHGAMKPVEFRQVEEVMMVCKDFSTKVMGGLRKCNNQSSDSYALVEKVDKKADLMEEKLKYLTEAVKSLVEAVGQINNKLNESKPLPQEETIQITKELQKTKTCECKKAGLNKYFCTRMAKYYNVLLNNTFFIVKGKDIDLDEVSVLTLGKRSILYYNNQQANWRLARDWCKAMGMQQPSLFTLSEVEQLAKQLRERPHIVYRFWLSASDIGRAPGQFHWVNGMAIDYSLKGADETHQFGIGKEACIYVESVANRIYDEECSRAYHILCEVPEEMQFCIGKSP